MDDRRLRTAYDRHATGPHLDDRRVSVEPATDGAEDTDAPEPQPSKDGAGALKNLERIPWYIQVPWVLAGALLFIVHAYGGEEQWRQWNRPLTDSLTLAYLVFILLGFMVNFLAEIGLPGGGKLKFRAETSAGKALASAAEYKVAAETFAELLMDWSHASATYNALLLRYGTNELEIKRIAARFCLERMEQYRIYFAQANEEMRLSVWWWIQNDGGLRLILSDEIRDETTLNYVFEPMEGLMGQAFAENEDYLIKDVRKSAYYLTIRPNFQYKGLLLIPFSAGVHHRPIGVLSIDSTQSGYVDQAVFCAAKALAQVIAMAYSHPKVIGALPDMGVEANPERMI